jgi:hypothetical protein
MSPSEHPPARDGPWVQVALLRCLPHVQSEILAQFTEQLQATGARKAPEMGALLDSKFSSVARNIAASFQHCRQFQRSPHLEPACPWIQPGFFAALIRGKGRGNFDVLYDPLAAEQVTVGATTYRDGRTFFDTWTKSDISGQTMFVEERGGGRGKY